LKKAAHRLIVSGAGAVEACQPKRVDADRRHEFDVDVFMNTVLYQLLPQFRMNSRAGKVQTDAVIR